MRKMKPLVYRDHIVLSVYSALIKKKKYTDSEKTKLQVE